MSSLAKTPISFLQAIASEVQIDPEGRGYLTEVALSRLTGVSQPTLNYHLNSDIENRQTKLSKKLAAHGFEGYRKGWGVLDVHALLIIEYFAFDANKTNEQALGVYRAFGGMTLRSAIRELKGWVSPSRVVEVQAPLSLESSRSKSDSIREAAGLLKDAFSLMGSPVVPQKYQQIVADRIIADMAKEDEFDGVQMLTIQTIRDMLDIQGLTKEENRLMGLKIGAILKGWGCHSQPSASSSTHKIYTVHPHHLKKIEGIVTQPDWLHYQDAQLQLPVSNA